MSFNMLTLVPSLISQHSVSRLKAAFLFGKFTLALMETNLDKLSEDRSLNFLLIPGARLRLSNFKKYKTVLLCITYIALLSARSKILVYCQWIATCIDVQLISLIHVYIQKYYNAKSLSV